MKIIFALILLGLSLSCSQTEFSVSNSLPLSPNFLADAEDIPLDSIKNENIRKILEEALRQTKITTSYTQDYFVIDYPNGDVPAETGACTDVVIRALRNAGVDLQKDVHEDMRDNFSAYPAKWGLKRTDKNIDHRRVPNLQTYFTRLGKNLPIGENADDYLPGDIVSWDLNGKGMTHIGLISHQKNEQTGRYMIIHNIGSGTKVEDRLFDWKITGRFRYF